MLELFETNPLGLVRSSGKLAGAGLHPLLEASVVQAAREQGVLVPVNAMFLDAYDRALRTQELRHCVERIFEEHDNFGFRHEPERSTMGR